MIRLDTNPGFREYYHQLSIQGVIIEDPANLELLVSRIKTQGKKIAVSTGVFDLVHLSHVSLLRNAQHEFEEYVVFFSFDSDRYTTQRKKNRPPIMSQKVRALSVYALACDFINHIFFHDSLEELLRLLQVVDPDILFGGPAYEGLQEIAAKIQSRPVVVDVDYDISSTKWARDLHEALSRRFAGT